MKANEQSESDFNLSGLLATDFYQLTMLDAYDRAGMQGRAIFEFFCRKLPPNRGFLLAAGLETLIEKLENARFSGAELDWLRSTGRFRTEMIEKLAVWRFTGNVDAVAEGTPVFQQEPLLRVEAPIAEAQLVETLVINHVHYQTLLASKAARMVLAARSRSLIDFGLRRAHSLEAGAYAARAAYLAGFESTATASAGLAFGIPVSGTMAHSFIQAHDDEEEAFRHFAEARPGDAVFLIDTYDTEKAAAKVVRLREPLRARGVVIRAVRIDSGDLAAHARSVRVILDAAGLREVKIIASGGLDEWNVARLVAAHAPIDAFGIGTSLTTSQDAPALDCAYKLVSYAGKARRKRSEGKRLWPGAKQIFRRFGDNGEPLRDTLAMMGERIEGETLLKPAMRGGRRLPLPTLEKARAHAKASLAELPPLLRYLNAPQAYRVDISQGLRDLARQLDAEGR